LSRPIIVRPLRESLVGNGIIPADDLQQTFATKSAITGHHPLSGHGTRQGVVAARMDHSPCRGVPAYHAEVRSGSPLWNQGASIAPPCGAVLDSIIVRCENTGKLCESALQNLAP
jgi:hypothetical protein